MVLFHSFASFHCIKKADLDCIGKRLPTNISFKKCGNQYEDTLRQQDKMKSKMENVNQLTVETTKLQHFFRLLLGALMVVAGIGHLTFQRGEFQAQVPDWIPLSKDLVVIVSGIVEVTLGASMIFWKKQRIKVGMALALFYVSIFPGNIAQYVNDTNAFGLDTDEARLIRLFFQPVLVIWALWSTGALTYLRSRKKK